jgi:hypothetical protein
MTQNEVMDQLDRLATQANQESFESRSHEIAAGERALYLIGLIKKQFDKFGFDGWDEEIE